MLMKKITKTISHGMLFLLLAFSSLAVHAYEWSSWRHLTTSGAAELQYRYMYRGEVTEVQWRVINKGYNDIYASVVDKEYQLRDGSSVSRTNEGSNVRGASTYTFQPDIIRGTVRSASANLRIR
jgi:hypothetical protein